MENKLAIFTQEIINIKDKYGTQYFAKAGFHSVLKDVYPSIENKYLMVFKAADNFQLYERIYKITSPDESKKTIYIDNLKQQFTEDSGLDVSIAAVVFWAYLYGNGLTKDKYSTQLKSSQEDATISNKANSEVFSQEETKEANKHVTSIASVTIGKQVWMAKNLNLDKFRNGDPIPHAKTDSEWKKASENKQPAWCYYDNEPANGEKYGKLYNWYAVNDSRGLAPAGWHIPSDVEWVVLTKDLGGADVAGKKMKSISGWKDGGNGTNKSGFSGLPGGLRNYYGTFDAIGLYGTWWSSSEYSTLNARYRTLSYNYGYVYRYYNYKEKGFSVRCLRD